ENNRGRITESFQDGEIGLCVALHLLFSGEKKNEGNASLLNELPGYDETIAPVVAFSAQNADREILEIFEPVLYNFGYAHSRVLHQDEAWNTVFFGGKTIDLADLFRSEDFHGPQMTRINSGIGKVGQTPINSGSGT